MDSGIWVLGSGNGFWNLASGICIMEYGSRNLDSELLKFWNPGCRIMDSGIWILGSGFRIIWLLEYGSWNLESGLWNQGCSIRVLEYGFRNMDYGIS